MRGNDRSGKRIRRAAIAFAVAAVGSLGGPGAAPGADHFINVREVFTGTVGHPNAEFIEIQMRASFQNLVAGNKLRVYNAAGALVATYTFPSNVANGANQSSILVATSDAISFFQVPADLAVTPAIPAAGGQVCYEDIDAPTIGILDCVSWGSFSAPPPTGDPGAVTGTPFNIAGGILDGLSINRDITGGSSSTMLDALDDTDDSAADFDFLNPAGPRNNAGAVTASAGSASVSGGAMTVGSASGIANNLLVSRSGNFYLVRDLAAPVVAGAGCAQSKTNLVRCATAPVTGITVNSGDGNDRVTIANAVNATVLGSTGADRLISMNGNVVLQGGDGNDVLDPGTGSDDMFGGAGADTATYAPRGAAAGVDVDIDGVADDGNVDDLSGGVRDNVRTDIERLIGGAGADELAGSGLPNQITGGAGADILRGLAANDTILAAGDGANDMIFCGQGLSDHAFKDPGDTVPPSGPEFCELIN